MRVRQKTIADVGILEFENAAEREALLTSRHDVGRLTHQRHLAGRALLGLDGDALRLVQVAFGDRRDAGRHGGGKERRLAGVWRGGENRFEVLGESHVEHLVGLVEDQHLERGEIERLATQVIQRAARGGDDDLDASPKRADLLVHRRPAVERHHGSAASAWRTCGRLRRPAWPARASAPESGRAARPSSGRASRAAGAASAARTRPSCPCRCRPGR